MSNGQNYDAVFSIIIQHIGNAVFDENTKIKKISKLLMLFCILMLQVINPYRCCPTL